MQSEVDDKKLEDESEAVAEAEVEAEVEAEEKIDTIVPEDTIVMSEDTFDDGDVSMEANVEGLVKEFENGKTDDVERKKEVRRKLDELAEENSFEDTYAVEFDDD